MCRLYYPENKRAEAPSGPIEYLDLGQGSPILYFHSTGAGNEVVPSMERPLLDSGFRLIVPNRPGYHGTPLNDRRSASACSAMAAELLDLLGIAKVAVIGTSGGGPTSSRFARELPERTVCLVLQCTESHHWDSKRWLPNNLRWALPLFRLRWLRPLLRWGAKRQVRRGQGRVEACIQGYSGARYEELSDEPALRRFIPHLLESSLICSQRLTGMENDWDVFLGEPWMQPGAIDCPTLVVHDRVDPVVPFIHAEWATQCIDHAELLDVHAAGHLIWYGQDSGRMHQRRTHFLRTHFGDLP